MKHWVVIVLSVLAVGPVHAESGDTCRGAETYMVRVAEARLLGKTKDEADQYGLDAVPFGTRVVFRTALVVWRSKARDMVYEHPLSPLEAAIVARHSCPQK